MKIKQVFFALFLSLLIFCTACSLPYRAAFSAQNTALQPLVIDAGHGGADGGAVSADGRVAESAINLQIARRLALLFSFCGHPVILTRSDENDLSSPEAATIREQKVSDLKNRVETINGSSAAALISIHQNSLPGYPKVHGAQVFYNTVPNSERMAQSTQNALNQTINPGNEKVCKAIDPGIYLMKEVRCPAILVECGFLSNNSETSLLCTEAHQIKLSLAITAGYLQYTNEGIS